ncbi:MAG TPA: hypothetical protein VM266_06010 [Solirubrobacteraceae bacterium]|nr:hypothetical protein [Solirubrobacteraceae bacterium]
MRERDGYPAGAPCFVVTPRIADLREPQGAWFTVSPYTPRS